MIAQMILPLLGGTPAVWNTCMVFFQATLLMGYAYSHGAATHLSVRRQTLIHIGLLCLPFVFFLLPFGIGAWTPVVGSNPVQVSFSVLQILLVSVGLPFFVVATSAPLLQRWFVSTGHPSAKDPYFLYGASNLGSMLALLSYPIAWQRNFELPELTWIWTGGYVLMIVLVSLCAWAAWRGPRTVELPAAPAEVAAKEPGAEQAKVPAPVPV